MNKIIPATKVRTEWRKLVKQLSSEQAVTVTRHYREEAVIADPDYFKELVQSYNHQKMLEAMDTLSASFERALRVKGKSPERLTEQEVDRLLDIKQ
ncbi:hypothetical protein HYZ64_01830 [Candidatus Berkelbacteria bacterium]|nr:hypothetical protein [Candidatus Berkelbacteria bacterium]